MINKETLKIGTVVIKWKNYSNSTCMYNIIVPYKLIFLFRVGLGFFLCNVG